MKLPDEYEMLIEAPLNIFIKFSLKNH